MPAKPSRSSRDEKAWLVLCCGQLYRPTGLSQPEFRSNLFLYGTGSVWVRGSGSWFHMALIGPAGRVDRVGYCFVL